MVLTSRLSEISKLILKNKSSFELTRQLASAASSNASAQPNRNPEIKYTKVYLPTLLHLNLKSKLKKLTKKHLAIYKQSICRCQKRKNI